MRSAAEILQGFGLPPSPDGKRRYYVICPKCSAQRSRKHQKSKCLGITISDTGVHFGCSHCSWKDGAYYNDKDGDSIDVTYNYRDESGAVLFQKVRTKTKKFWVRRPDGRDGWVNGIKESRRVLYRLPEIIEAMANERTILIVEGEKDVDSLWRIGVPATCNFDGAAKFGEMPKWRPECSETLRGADVVVMPDHDEAGYAHAEAAASMLAGTAKQVRVLKLADHWPDCPKGGDVSDWLARGHTREEFDALIEQAVSWMPTEDAAQATLAPRAERTTPPPTDKPKSTWRDGAIIPQELCDQKFPDIKWIIRGLIPEGVTLVASRPKLGKSWLFLQVGGASATRTATLVADDQPIQGDVLYLALEDNPRRLQRRLRKLFGLDKNTWPGRLTIFTKWKRLDQGGLDDIRDWCKSVPSPTLVLIDTLKRVRAPKKGNQSDYDADYEASQPLQDLAGEFQLAVMVAHHDRKMDADDVFDTVSGTLGLTGGVDTIAVLKRKAGVVTLHIQGRDLEEEIEKAVTFNRETCRWIILGEASDVRQSDERGRVLASLEGATEGLRSARSLRRPGCPGAARLTYCYFA